MHISTANTDVSVFHRGKLQWLPLVNRLGENSFDINGMVTLLADQLSVFAFRPRW